MSDLSGTIKQLIEERNRLNAAIAALQSVSNRASGKGSRMHSTRTMSAAGRARIAAAQRARWKKFRAKNKAA